MSSAMPSHAMLSRAMLWHMSLARHTHFSHLSSAADASSAGARSPCWPQHPVQPRPYPAPGAQPHPAHGGHELYIVYLSAPSLFVTQLSRRRFC